MSLWLIRQYDFKFGAPGHFSLTAGIGANAVSPNTTGAPYPSKKGG